MAEVEEQGQNFGACPASESIDSLSQPAGMTTSDLRWAVSARDPAEALSVYITAIFDL